MDGGGDEDDDDDMTMTTTTVTMTMIRVVDFLSAFWLSTWSKKVS